MPTFTLALDKASSRTYDVDGRLRVDACNITKATVNPYWGKEIPGWQELGLDPSRVYNLLRDPAELEKAASTFTNIPLLIVHKGVTAGNHDKEVVVGTIGDATWAPPYVRADLCVWTAEAIAGIESKQQTELSCGYRYRPDMTPGIFEGVKYDGVMRDIIGNHVALVEVGRAGSDVVVADQNPFHKGLTMKLKTPQANAVAGALRVYLAPKLAQDAQIGGLGELLADVRAATFKKEAPALATRIQAHFAGKLAQDASLADLPAILAMCAMDEDTDPKAEDEDDDNDKSRATDAPDLPENDGKAMDAATVQRLISDGIQRGIAAAMPQLQQKMAQDSAALASAKADVAPLVGEVALDSAEAVYKFALDHAKVDTTGVHPSAYRAMFKLHQQAAAAKPVASPLLSLDAATVKANNDLFGLGRIGQI